MALQLVIASRVHTMFEKHRFLAPARAAAALLLMLAAMFAPAAAFAASEGNLIDFTTHWAGFAALGIFTIAYLVVIGEEVLHLR
jgi:hypothetical protein